MLVRSDEKSDKHRLGVSLFDGFHAAHRGERGNLRARCQAERHTLHFLETFGPENVRVHRQSQLSCGNYKQLCQVRPDGVEVHRKESEPHTLYFWLPYLQLRSSRAVLRRFGTCLGVCEETTEHRTTRPVKTQATVRKQPQQNPQRPQPSAAPSLRPVYDVMGTTDVRNDRDSIEALFGEIIKQQQKPTKKKRKNKNPSEPESTEKVDPKDPGQTRNKKAPSGTFTDAEPARKAAVAPNRRVKKPVNKNRKAKKTAKKRSSSNYNACLASHRRHYSSYGLSNRAWVRIRPGWQAHCRKFPSSRGG